MQVSVKKLFYLTFYAFDNLFQLSSPQMWLLQLPTQGSLQEMQQQEGEHTICKLLNVHCSCYLILY